MKKSIYFAALASVMLAAACQKAELSENQPAAKADLVPVTFTATLDDTKAFLDEMYINWEESDKIAVWDGTAKQEFSISNISGNTATFSGEVTAESTEFYMVYPFSAFSKVESETITVTVPATQTMCETHNVSKDALICAAYTADLSAPVSFKNAVSLVKFSIDEAGVKSLVLKSNGSEKFVGATTVDKTVSTITSTGSASLTVKPFGETFAIGDYYAAVAPFTGASGIKVALSYSDKKVILSTANEVTFARAAGKNLGAVASNAKAETLPFEIMTPAQLKAFAANISLFTSGETVSLGADINMQDQAWVIPTATLACTFDGANHKIYNIVVNANEHNVGLFPLVSGNIKNLIVGSSDGTTYDGVSSFTSTFSDQEATKYVAYLGLVTNFSGSGSLKNIKNFANFTYSPSLLNPIYTRTGCICAYYLSTGIMEDCENHGNLTINAQFTGACNIGGLVGQLASTATIKNCKNYGVFDYQGTGWAASLNLGAVVGYCASKATFDGCENHGTIEVTGANGTDASGQVSVGGILGYSNSAASTFKNCKNYGTVKKTSTNQKNHTFLGGIVGYSNIASTFTNCSNEEGAEVSNSGSSSGKHVSIGGILGKNAGGAATITNCANHGSVRSTGATTYVRDGGILGEAAVATSISGCVNDGEVYNSGKSSNGTANTVPNILVGGIVGHASGAAVIDNCENKGSVVNKGLISTANNLVTVGGIVACSAAAGKITNCTCTFVSAEKTKIQENGNHTSISPYTYVGGILGYSMTAALADFSGNVNNIPVTVSNTHSLVHAAGIVGFLNTATEVKNCTNTARIENAGKGTYVYCACIVGRSEISGNKITNCTNTGSFINSGVNSTDGGIRCGGIIGQSRYTVITGCSQNGDVKNTYEVADTKATNLGGIIGLTNVNSASITDCTVTGGEISSAGLGTNNLAAICNTTIAASPVNNCGVKEGVVVGETALTSENWSSLLFGSTQKAAVSTTTPNYFIAL